MKKLVLSAMFVGGLAHLATGCVINGGDPDPEFGGVEVTWSLVAGDNNTLVGCPLDAPTMLVHYADPVNPDIIFATDEFFCIDASAVDSPNGIAESSDLAPGTYSVWLELLDEAGNVYAASFVAENVDVFVGVNTIVEDFVFSVDRAFFYADWDLTLDGVRVGACGDVDVSYFALDGTYIANSDLYPNEFVCNDFAGQTDEMPLGEWTLSPAVLDAARNTVEVGESVDGNYLDYGNQLADAGTFIFDFVTP